MPSNFDDILNLAKGNQPTPEAESPPVPPPPPRAPKSVQSRARQPQVKREPPRRSDDPWGDLLPPEKEPTIRLNVDIPISLNDKLTDKARQVRKPKTELIRRLLEWALDDSIE